jgi:hypothetical protein
VFAPASPDRARVVPRPRAVAAGEAVASSEPPATDRQHTLTWARRLKRVFACFGVASLAWIDIELCRRCGGKLKVIASIEEPAVIERILEHLGGDGKPADPANPRQAKRRRRQSRAPPQGDLLI